jgi:hypothetical protein
MPRPVARKLFLADVMVLVAVTALGLVCYLALDNSLFRGQRYLFGLFVTPKRGWVAAEVVNRATGITALMLPLFGGWSIALPLLQLWGPRLDRRRLERQPGLSACLAALTGLATSAGCLGIALALRGWVDGTTQFPPMFWAYSPALDNPVIFPGVSVAAVWVVQAVNGHWRPVPDWPDRLGRILGVLWIAEALLFAVRLLLRP